MPRMDFAERYGPWAVIAGGSEGVGASVARQLGARGVNVVLVSRRQEPLDDVAATVAAESRTVVLDLSEADATARLADAVQRDHRARSRPSTAPTPREHRRPAFLSLRDSHER